MIAVYPISNIRNEFPIFRNKDKNIIYLDNAASTQKPYAVINEEIKFYTQEYSSVHRSIHSLGNKATNRMENVRKKIAKFINASSFKEIIFVKGATEGINLVAYSWGRKNIKFGDNILITEMEHHANIIPWQILSKEKGAVLKYIPCLPDGMLDINSISNLINEKTRLVALTHMSNVLGLINPLDQIIPLIRETSNAVILIDGSQNIVHNRVNVQNIDCDFYVFSGHKLYGPTGIGVLYVRKKILELMPPWESGGSMIKKVNLYSSIFNDIPWRFEAGSPNTTGILGLGSAVEYINSIGMENIKKHELLLTQYTLENISKISGIKIYGPNDRTSIIAFNLDNFSSYDIGCLLDNYGIAIRTGHHCAMPLMKHFRTYGMCRISLAMYNNKEEIDILINSLIKISKLLK